MVKTFGNYLYSEFKLNGTLDKFSINNSPEKNLEILEELLISLNITKGRISDVEMSYPGSINHLLYLLQHKNYINFNLCENYKVWKNNGGWQYGCALDKGKEQRIQVYCYGLKKICEKLI